MGTGGVRLVLSDAGTSIAMGNAAADLQALATHSTATNDDDGFAAAMRDLVLTN